jgi:hypothetical protein
VLYDNLGKHAKAVEFYRKFLELCQATSDTVGLGLAYNCLGVDLMNRACPPERGARTASMIHTTQCQLRRGAAGGRGSFCVWRALLTLADWSLSTTRIQL